MLGLGVVGVCFLKGKPSVKKKVIYRVLMKLLDQDLSLAPTASVRNWAVIQGVHLGVRVRQGINLVKSPGIPFEEAVLFPFLK